MHLEFKNIKIIPWKWPDRLLLSGIFLLAILNLLITVGVLIAQI